MSNVYARFSQACKAIGSQEWVLNMENRQYKSIPIDDMRAGVRKACIEAGIVHVGPIDTEFNREVLDGRTYRYYGTCKFRYVSTENPEEFIEFESAGEAMDNGDKGVGKFLTNLIKNHYKAAFDIGELGKDDVDSYSNEELYEEGDRITAKRESAKQSAEGFALAKECKAAINKWIGMNLNNASHEVIAEYCSRFGQIEQWSPGTCIQCYKELRDAGVGIKEVAL